MDIVTTRVHLVFVTIVTLFRNCHSKCREFLCKCYTFTIRTILPLNLLYYNCPIRFLMFTQKHIVVTGRCWLRTEINVSPPVSAPRKVHGVG